MTRPRKKSRCKRDSNPGPSALEADALTTRPTRRSGLRDTEISSTSSVHSRFFTHTFELSHHFSFTNRHMPPPTFFPTFVLCVCVRARACVRAVHSVFESVCACILSFCVAVYVLVLMWVLVRVYVSVYVCLCVCLCMYGFKCVRLTV